MLNQIVLMGRLTSDPELRYTQSQTAVASFTVAVERDYAPQGGSREVDFISCVAWRQTGEFVERHFHKGNMISLVGRLESRRWETRDGEKRISWEVNVDRVYFTGERTGDAEAKPPKLEELPDDDGELPF